MRTLVASASPDAGLKAAIQGPAVKLFAGSVQPRAALSGLWLYFDCFDESHRVAQDDSSVEGSYWHGICHRREPDASNAAYWFRQTGHHEIFNALLKAARELTPFAGYRLGNRWDPFAFIDFCEEARMQGGAYAAYALSIQRIEWELLFDYCARKADAA